MNLAAIREALATKVRLYIQNAQPSVNVKAFEGLTGPPIIEVAPGDPYIVHWDPDDDELTFGANGISKANFEVKAYIPPSAGAPEVAQKVMDELLSIGTDSPASLFDAVMQSPRTLGGASEEMRATHARTAPPNDNGVSGTVYVRVYARRGGAQV